MRQPSAAGIFAEGNPADARVTGNAISGNAISQVKVRLARGLRVVS